MLKYGIVIKYKNENRRNNQLRKREKNNTS